MGRHSSSSGSESEEGSLSDSSVEERRKSKSRSTSRSKSKSRSITPKESRSRPQQRSQPESMCLSRYYREHFGNHSPEMYLNLRISKFRNSLSKENVIDILEDELRKMAPFEIKVVPSPDGSDRFAYLNFKNQNCAKTVRQTMISTLQKKLGSGVMIDPAGVLRDQEGKYIPDRFNRAQMAAHETNTSHRRRFSPPPSHRHQQSHNNNNYNSSSQNGHSRSFNLNREDNQATRTLFVGNLPGDVRHSELVKTFDQYGEIEDIDIKMVNDGVAAFAFVVYVAVDSAMKGLKNQHGRSIRPNSSKCQIGYGRSQVSTRLWIGGLGDWTTKEMLMKEFDRYGVIEQLEYSSGAPYAYLRFADVNSATDACVAMKNFNLYKDYKIMVDYAKEKKVDRKRTKSSSPNNDSSSAKRRKPRTPSRSESPADSANEITTYEQLNEQTASTWKGIVALKKTEYPLRLHRVYGREHLLQDLLREEDGSAIRLKLDQRITRDSLFYDKLMDMDPNQLAFMVGAEGSHSFTPLIEYLNDKKAIGMTQVSEKAILYLMPHCSLATKIIKKFAPRVHLLKSENNFLLVILKATDR